MGKALHAGLSPVRRGLGSIRRWSEPRRKVVIPVAAIVVIALAAILPYLDTWFVIPVWLQRATNSSVLAEVGRYSLFALGLNVVVGFAGLLDLGYVAFWAIGAYTAALLSGAAGFTKGLRAHTVTIADKPQWIMWMWLILLAALVVAVLAGILLGLPTLRLRGDYLAIVTLGFGEIIRITANNLDSITLGPRGVASIPHPEINVGSVHVKFGSLTDVKYYWLFLVLLVIWIVAITLLDRSRIGRAWVAIREDEVAASAMGVPILKMKLAAFAIGACTAGVAGAIYAEQVNFINPPTFSVLNSILILCMVVIGGMGSIPGAITGAAVIVLLPEVFKSFAEYRYFIFGLALIVVMIFRPQGFIPSRRRQAELKGAVVEDQLSDALRETEPGAGRTWIG